MPKGVYDRYASSAWIASLEKRKWQGPLLCGHDKPHRSYGLCDACGQGRRRYGSFEAYLKSPKVRGKPFIKGHVMSSDTKAKMAASRTGSRNPMFGKTRTREERDRISATKRALGSNRRERNGNWRGGISRLTHIIRTHPHYQEWRISILKRDHYTCQKCGKHGGDLNVDHHPKTFAWLIKEYSIQSLEDALSCDSLWDVNSNRTLCVPCHKAGDVQMSNNNRAKNVI